MINYLTQGKLNLTLNLCTNSDLFTKIASLSLVKPKVPQFYLAQRDVYIENPDHPKYKEAVRIYEYTKATHTAKLLLLAAVSEDATIIDSQRGILRYKLVQSSDGDIWYSYLQSILSPYDISGIINICFLTENKVYDMFNVLSETIHRGNVEISEARLKNAINTQIQVSGVAIHDTQLVHPLDEYTACIESNINWIEWQLLSSASKAEVIALYRIRTIVKNHAEDEAQQDSERRNKNKG